MPADALKTLHTALLDTQEGYRTAVDDTGDPTLKSLFAEMIALRRRHHDAIHAALTALGEKADDGGSLMGTVHKTAINVRAAITGINGKALSAFISGEEHIVSEYDAALRDSTPYPAVLEVLIQQKEELLAMIAKMRAVAPGDH